DFTDLTGCRRTISKGMPRHEPIGEVGLGRARLPPSRSDGNGLSGSFALPIGPRPRCERMIDRGNRHFGQRLHPQPQPLSIDAVLLGNLIDLALVFLARSCSPSSHEVAARLRYLPSPRRGDCADGCLLNVSLLCCQLYNNRSKTFWQIDKRL